MSSDKYFLALVTRLPWAFRDELREVVMRTIGVVLAAVFLTACSGATGNTSAGSLPAIPSPTRTSVLSGYFAEATPVPTPFATRTPVPALISGTVVDADTKAPIPGVVVVAFPWSPTCALSGGPAGGSPQGGDGSFRIIRVAPGQYVLHIQPQGAPAYSDGFLQSNGSVSISVCGTPARITVPPAVDLTIPLKHK